ncbi:hypothetical protein B296_00022854 [Ensete ventricosum]|uniref:Uncharacterized protein n=1 Tax=Ensete ventricosum TaxID=4639 RepID=A0A426ZA42_ENSVE|nr:hypothetical protein B296_00022854 [Ensete ventricosum]
MLVALSTGWYDSGSRCNKNIKINADGRTALAKVIDDCDSVKTAASRSITSSRRARTTTKNNDEAIASRRRRWAS